MSRAMCESFYHGENGGRRASVSSSPPVLTAVPLRHPDHFERFFFPRLVTFMSSGPLEAVVLSGPNAVESWRSLCGPTHVKR